MHLIESRPKHRHDRPLLNAEIAGQHVLIHQRFVRRFFIDRAGQFAQLLRRWSLGPRPPIQTLVRGSAESVGIPFHIENWYSGGLRADSAFLDSVTFTNAAGDRLTVHNVYEAEAYAGLDVSKWGVPYGRLTSYAYQDADQAWHQVSDSDEIHAIVRRFTTDSDTPLTD